MRVAVTGATGNLGSALLRRLAGDEGAHVVGVCRRPPGTAGVDWHGIDVGAPDAAEHLTRAFGGCDAVVHLAWALQPGHDRAALHRANVEGSAHVAAAARAAGVKHLVVITSVGSYAPGPKDRPVGEDWPTTGVRPSSYSRDKTEVERGLDAFEAEGDAPLVTRVRPALVFQARAASEIAALFLGPLVPRFLLGRLRLPALPLPAALSFQTVHADDVASAVTTILAARAGGAFNVAADPALTPDDLARAVGAGRAVPLPRAALRAVVSLSWHLRLQPTEPGWIDLAISVPLMSTERLRDLGWAPTVEPRDALAELVAGMRGGTTDPANPPLSGSRRAPARRR